MGVSAHGVGDTLTALIFLFMLGYYTYICLRFKQYDHSANIMLAWLNIGAAVLYLISAPLPWIPHGCELFYNGIAALYMGSQILLFTNRVIFSFYQMSRNVQLVLKITVFQVLIFGSASTVWKAFLGIQVNGAITPGEYACYVIRAGSPDSTNSPAASMASTLLMFGAVIAMVTPFVFAVKGLIDFKRATVKKENLTTLYLVLLSFASTLVSEVVNTLDQINKLAGLSGFRKAQQILDSIIALAVALVIHRKIAARAARVKSAATGATSEQRQTKPVTTMVRSTNPQVKYEVARVASSSTGPTTATPNRPE
ncbi:hypothetical protein PBRA_004343 [Plasmodiophora brassicae]|nr:hypothetical protein PBRA_004343 [Plasmodiophora brassicae]